MQHFDNFKEELTQVAERHGISLWQLLRCCAEKVEKEDRMEDIETVFEEEGVKKDSELLEAVWQRFNAAESAEFGIWDNIRAAMDYLGINDETYPAEFVPCDED